MTILENVSKKIKVEGVNYNYIYRLIKSQVSVLMYGEFTNVNAYGIEIESQNIVDGKIVHIQRDCVENISPQRYKVKNLLKLLYDNTVSPIHMIDILGEYIDDYTSDFNETLNCIATN